MSAIFGLVCVASFLVVALGVGFAFHQATEASWRKVGARLGLEYYGSWMSGHRLEGEHDGVQLVLRTYTTGSGKSKKTWTEASATHAAMPLSLDIGSEGFWTALGKVVSGDDVQIGDPSFDGKAHVKGDERVASAVLDADARAELQRLLSRGGNLTGGAARVVASGAVSSKPRLLDMLDTAERTARALNDREGKPARLARQAWTDPSPGARARCLEVLLAHYPAAPESVRLVDQLVYDTRAEASLREPAIRYAARKRLDRLREALPTLLTQAAVREAAVEAAVELEVDPGAAALVALMRTGDARARRVALEAAAKHAHRELEPFALAELDNEENRVAAARALATIGSVAAVAPLLPMANGGLFSDPALRKAARDAINAIQHDLGDVERGGLSVAEPGTEGGLSLPAGERGALSRGTDGDQ